jgi:hypothetical protein
MQAGYADNGRHIDQVKGILAALAPTKQSCFLSLGILLKLVRFLLSNKQKINSPQTAQMLPITPVLPASGLICLSKALVTGQGALSPAAKFANLSRGRNRSPNCAHRFALFAPPNVAPIDGCRRPFDRR